MPLPKGRVRFYRRNDDGQVEFTGENTIDHTPRDETIRIYTGNSFDLSGERHRTNYAVDTGKSSATETFEIKVRNHKKEAGGGARGRAPLSRQELGDRLPSPTTTRKRTARPIEFPVNDCSRRREDDHLYGPLHLVRTTD